MTDRTILARIISRKASWLAIALSLTLAGCAELTGPTTQTPDKTPASGSAAATPPGTSGGPPFRKNYKVGKPYQVAGQWYYPQIDLAYEERGIASWYGPNFHGKRTANGEVFDMTQISAAHRTLPMPSVVRVTNLENGRSLIVRINDRGPFARGRIIDLSRRAAELLGFTAQGTAMVHIRLLPEESRQAALQAGATSQDMASFGPPPPEAAPSIPVAIEALPSTSQSAAVASGPVSGTGGFGAPPPYAGMTAIMPDEGMPVAAVAPQPKPSRQIAAAPQSAVSQAPDAGTEPDSRVEQIRVNGHPRIFIQAGAFRQYVNANRLRARLTPLGHPVNVSQIYVTNQPFFRVRLGPLANVEDADLALERIVSLGYPEARIVVD